MPNADLAARVEGFRKDYGRLRAELTKIVVGQEEGVDGALAALFGGGHALLEGLPGTGKTLIVKVLAAAIDGQFRRVQFTPDLMPADVIGTYVVLEQHGRRRFEFQQGPIFANILLADEINRATPKTQSGLLEAMEEGVVTVANETYPLPKPFCALATQSPNAAEGTFPLPETQLDRFLFKLRLTLPDENQCDAILAQSTAAERPTVAKVLAADRIVEMQQVVREIEVGSDLRKLAASYIARTQPSDQASSAVKSFVRQGASLRGAQAMLVGAKVRAAAAGRSAATKDDLNAWALPALRHRLVLSFDAHALGRDADAVVREILGTSKA